MDYKIYYYGTPKYNVTKQSRTNKAIKYIVVHYTGSGVAENDSAAKNNCIYFNGCNRNASADFFINNAAIWCFNNDPRKYYTWHCGDGRGKYGITNANSIGIEVVSKGADFTVEEINKLTFLVQKLMKEYEVPAENVVRHWDASRKTCPAPYSGTAAKNKKWTELHKKITGQGVAATTQTEPQVETKGEVYIVNTAVGKRLLVRAEPKTTAKVVTRVNRGEAYTIMEIKNGYGKLKSGVGWVSMKYMVKR